MGDDLFTGKHFSQEPLEPEEIAAHREFMAEARSRWQTLVGLDQIGKGMNMLGKVIAGAAIIGAGVAAAAKAGWFG